MLKSESEKHGDGPSCAVFRAKFHYERGLALLEDEPLAAQAQFGLALGFLDAPAFLFAGGVALERAGCSDVAAKRYSEYVERAATQDADTVRGLTERLRRRGDGPECSSGGVVRSTATRPRGVVAILGARGGGDVLWLKSRGQPARRMDGDSVWVLEVPDTGLSYAITAGKSPTAWREIEPLGERFDVIAD